MDIVYLLYIIKSVTIFSIMYYICSYIPYYVCSKKLTNYKCILLGGIFYLEFQ